MVLHSIIKNYLREMENSKVLEWLEKAKEFYIEHEVLNNRSYFNCGMCWSLATAAKEIIGHTFNYYRFISESIPEFKPITFGIAANPSHHWWPVNNTQIRIEAFDKLINIYKEKIKNEL